MSKEIKNKAELVEMANKKAEELTAKLGKKVYPMVLNTADFKEETGEWVVGYIKAPSLYQKASIIDNFDTGNKTMKGIEFLKLNLIKEESDIRFTQIEDSRNDNIILGAALFITGKGFRFSIVESTEELKKNGE